MKAKSFIANRRNFIKLVTGGGASLFFPWKSGSGRVLAAIPGGTLLNADIPEFMAPVLIPPVMPKAGTITRQGGMNIDSYEISVKESFQQILPPGFPTTKVWGYGAVRADSNRGLLVHNAPSLTIETSWNRPVRVKWINGLVDANGNCLPHLLPVDPTLHWADPTRGMHGRNTRPQFTSTPGA